VTDQALFHVLFGVFVFVHGLIHLVYAGQSARLWEAKPGLIWPDESWALSRCLGDVKVRRLAGVVFLVLAAGLGAGGVGCISDQVWWRPVVVGAAAVSALAFCLLWNGRRQSLDGQGLIGMVISAGILVAAVIVR
jgi:hypothetical protein